MADHLVEANKQQTSIQTTIDTFQSYIDDDRVVDPEKEGSP